MTPPVHCVYWREVTMLEGTSISRPVGRAEIKGAAQPGVNTALLLFLLLLVAVSALTCLYVYQVNAMTKIENETWYTEQEIARLDREMTPLQLELAGLLAPQLIDSASAQLGMNTGGPAMRAPVLATPAPDQPTTEASSLPTLRTFMEWLSAQALRVGVQVPWDSVLGYR